MSLVIATTAFVLYIEHTDTGSSGDTRAGKKDVSAKEIEALLRQQREVEEAQDSLRALRELQGKDGG